MPPIEQRSQPPRGPLPVAPPHSPQAESCYDSTQRDAEWPELVSFAEQARRSVRAKVVRVVADRTEAAIWSLCESGRGGKTSYTRSAYAVCVISQHTVRPGLQGPSPSPTPPMQPEFSPKSRQRRKSTDALEVR